MKSESNYKSLLGLSQEEAAMLLGITRLQWAQFVTGRRDIPVAAKLKLAEVLSNIKENKTVPLITKEVFETEKKKAQDWMLKEIKELEHKKIILDRKIEKSNEAREEAFKALDVVRYLESKNDISMAKFIKSRVIKTLIKHSLQHLEELELKKESYKMLKLHLEKKLKF